jgi:hypothetical protein
MCMSHVVRWVLIARMCVFVYPEGGGGGLPLGGPGGIPLGCGPDGGDPPGGLIIVPFPGVGPSCKIKFDT